MAKEETKKTSTKQNPKKEVKKNTSSSKKTNTSNSSKKTSNTQKASSKTTSTAAKKQTTIVQEENSYGRTLIAALLIALVFLGGYLTIRFNGEDNEDANYVATADEKAFKEEYEGLNGTTYSSGEKISEIEIIADNNIKYISMEEAVKMLDSGSGVIYFGYASCSYCRNATPVLLEAMSSSELDTIYYVNLRPTSSDSLTGAGSKENDLRDEYTLNSKNKAKKTSDAAESYYEVLTSLANHLDDYVLYTDAGKKVSTGEKRLYAPTVVSVINGEIVGFHQLPEEYQTNDENSNIKNLTNAEKKELLNSYSEVISNYLKNNK